MITLIQFLLIFRNKFLKFLGNVILHKYIYKRKKSTLFYKTKLFIYAI